MVGIIVMELYSLTDNSVLLIRFKGAISGKTKKAVLASLSNKSGQKKVQSYIVGLDTIYQELISMYDWSRRAFVSYKWGIPVSQYAMDHDYNWLPCFVFHCFFG